jgi:hypothetical protein
MTASTYLAEAIDAIDSKFGEGYAEDHPQLTGAFIQTCALDFAAGILASRMSELTEQIASLPNDIDTFFGK